MEPLSSSKISSSPPKEILFFKRWLDHYFFNRQERQIRELTFARSLPRYLGQPWLQPRELIGCLPHGWEEPSHLVHQDCFQGLHFPETGIRSQRWVSNPRTLTPPGTVIPPSSLSLPATLICSLSLDLLIADISCKWNHITHGFFETDFSLVYFQS